MQLSYASSEGLSTRVKSYNAPAHPVLHKVSGRVLCFDGSFPLEGVLVREKNSGLETRTRNDGTWSLELPAGKKTMEFEYAGYEVQRVHVNRPLPFQVILKKQFNPMGNLVYSALCAHRVNP